MAGVRVPGGTGWSGTRITRRVTVPTDVDGLRLLRSGVVSVSLLAYICTPTPYNKVLSSVASLCN